MCPFSAWQKLKGVLESWVQTSGKEEQIEKNEICQELKEVKRILTFFSLLLLLIYTILWPTREFCFRLLLPNHPVLSSQHCSGIITEVASVNMENLFFALFSTCLGNND